MAENEEDGERVRYLRRGKMLAPTAQIKVVTNEDYTLPAHEMFKYQKEARLLLA